MRRSVGYDPDLIVQTMKNEEDQVIEQRAHKPDLLILLDYQNNKWATREANLCHVPIIAICDSDCDPRYVYY